MKSWENRTIVGVGLLVVLFGTGNYWSATWLSKWALLLVLFGVAISFWAALKTSLLYLPLMVYGFLSLIATSVWPESPYKMLLDPVVLLALQKNTLYGLAVWTMSLVTFMHIGRRHVDAVLVLLSTIWALGIVGYLTLPLAGAHSPPNNGMWFGNPSMGASLLACLWPFAWACVNLYGQKHRRKILFQKFATVSWMLTLAAIYRTRASVPWGVLGIVTAAIFVSRRGILRLWTNLGLILLSTTMLWSGWNLLGSTFFDQNGRFDIWRMAFDHFWKHAPHAWGWGFASSQVLLPVEQITTGTFHGDYFLWLHNDWLQLAIEGGYVGMTCVFLALFRLLSASWHRPALFSFLCGFVTLGLFNYPLRMPIHCMCLVLVCGIVEAWAPKAIVWVEKEHRFRRTAARKAH